MFQPGDRVRWETVGDDGLPLVRYGFVGRSEIDREQVVVMLDGELKDDTFVASDQLAQVTITNLELRFHGADLLADPALRQGLVNLWSAEADRAGLEVRDVRYLGTGVHDPVTGGFALAELQSGGRRYVLRATCDGRDMVCVRADHPRRWET